MKVNEFNRKYEKIYNEELGRKAPDTTDDNNYSIDADGNVTKAVPIGYDEESLKFAALTQVIDTAFTKDKDYVCWSDGGYTKEDKHPLTTKEGDHLMAYDPVLLLGNFGEPMAFLMFTGNYEISGMHFKPEFIFIDNIDEEIRTYCPEVYYSDVAEIAKYNDKIAKKNEQETSKEDSVQ